MIAVLLQDSDLFFFGSLLESVCLGMAPKSVLWARTKKAGEMLAAQKEVDMLAKQKKEIRMSMSKLQKEKKAARQARQLKAKAAKCSLGDLLQMLMMKAFVMDQEAKNKTGSASSSSTDPWMPKDAQEAFQKIIDVTSQTEEKEVQAFATLLRNEATPPS